ncbi:probable leucine-rich repeat receptor-like protein kinase At1g68400 [Magnolia sinica]|uniref:probable leucine-rich repeat receptor-like protein kinase At1g68400 n=1 Tax=Magnolia sinica TaxID=86752 RepID=UPI0026596825|nr:probable leucine-rich repeat receptor-like protein kinase At1g68400 [Magnolia sinica]
MNFTLTIFTCLMIFAIRFAKAELFAGERDELIYVRDSLTSTANLHSMWTGPPCHNNISKWVGIACLNSHVVHIVLEGIQLNGSLPTTFLQNITYLSKLSLRNNSLFGPLPSFANLVHLQYIFLSQNHFSGPIPLEFINLPNLKRLELQENLLNGTIPPFNQSTLTAFNVSNNFLNGPIPETPVLLRFPRSSYDHNSELCGQPLGKPCQIVPVAPVGGPPPTSPSPRVPTPSKDKTLRVWSIALIAVAALLVPFTVMLVFLCYYRRKHGKGTKEKEHSGEISPEVAEKRTRSSESIGDPGKTIELEFFDWSRPVFDLEDLLRASAEMMGKGMVGSSYKAVLESGLVVSVKRVKEMNGLSKKEFVQQMQLLGKLRHENLVEMISFYYSKEEKLVVYEYVPGGSLFELLHGNRGAARIPLDWATRLLILKGIAVGLTYLHQSLPSHRVPHANLKSSNVLIAHNDRNYHPKITHFGFQPLLPPQKAIELLASGKSPEASKGKKLTHKADVYCFGLIMLEVITGRIPGEFSPGNIDTTDDLSEWVRSVVHRDWSTDILDLEILPAKEGHEEMLQLTEVALECTNSMPERRPKMSEVLKRIEEIKEEDTKKGETEGRET